MISQRVTHKISNHFVKIFAFVLLLPSLEVKAYLPLVFPPTAPTRIQWIVGIGIPLQDLRFESMTSGWVLKAEYFLPETVQQLKTHNRLPISAGRKLSAASKFENFLALDEELHSAAAWNTTKTSRYLKDHKHIRTSYRWTVYKGLEGLANRMGLPGRDCVLKSICEEAENPFHFFNGLIGEMLHILLTPSSSADALSTHSDNEYFHAEHMGRSGAKCDEVFRECPESLLNRFSNVHKLSKDLMAIIG